MSHPRTKTASSICAALAFVVLLLSAGSALGQRNPPPLMTERERMQRENDRRLIGPYVTDEMRIQNEMSRPRRPATRFAVAAEIKKDAERMRFFNSQMLNSAPPVMALDHESIIKAAGEIKKRAARIRLNLGLPLPEKKKRSPQEQVLLDERELAASFLKLDGLVKSLTANPLLSSRSLIDAAQAATATRDIDEIISLSELIKKSAKRLKQARR